MNRRDYMKTSVQEPPLDYSFKSIHVIQDLVSEEPRTGLRPLRHSKSGKSLTQSLWLNNNVLNELRDFSQVVSQLLEHPENLAWIDLSFNDLTSIDPVLTTFFNLSVLYLHGNSIQRLGEVDKLAVLPRLRSLTLHGNPMEEEKGYRILLKTPYDKKILRLKTCLLTPAQVLPSQLVWPPCLLTAPQLLGIPLSLRQGPQQ
ncbi:leucine-rich repeat-containing protein 51 isoform 1-T3 [Trichechus inunguis]|uniref:Leucine-rich repeat-containing protein 51 n=1 Tax=Trichechus manatus latirostris TaxID=127582 RepID=A0A2Y9RAB0_TRIMA|nr:leucine-rich repeat-containing protein 51 isoform X1 [Trichechus manatus latirostris]